MKLFPLAWGYLRTRALLLLSAVAIALGVAVLFTVLAVMNGFLQELEQSVRTESGDAIIEPLPPRYGGGHSLEDYKIALADVPGLQSLEPRLNYYGLVGRRGARALSDPRSTDLSGLLLQGKENCPPWDSPNTSLPPLWIGKQAAERLGLLQGDSLEVLSFQQQGGKVATLRATFQIAGTLQSGRFDHDLDRALVRRADLADILHHDPGFSEISVRGTADVDPLLFTEKLERALQTAGISTASFPLAVSWRRQAGSLLRAVEDQRELLGVMFFFIVLVAAYQLVATLTLLVTEKRRDIGILRALGATPANILIFYVALGGFLALAGSVLGLCLGLWASNHLETIEKWLGGGDSLFRAEIYHFDHIPVAVEWVSAGWLVGLTLCAAVLFSLWPAWNAARLQVLDILKKR
ncbi:MAG: ABC transporter permease [Planctomycetota bacterium]|nr:ABC transporter permease [Planctomycetota bacterium]